MRIWLDVETAREGAELRRGLRDPTVRAFVRVMGTPPMTDVPAAAVCGGRCFLEFIDALRQRDAGTHDEQRTRS